MRTMYFAYGSNMNTERMRSRTPSAKVIGRARLMDKRMVCNKKSRDGSGKANIVDSPGDYVLGVLYEIDLAELDRLDRAEDGYQRTNLPVWTEKDGPLTAFVYISMNVTTDPVPYEWY